MKIKSSEPCWYAIMADEATDVSGKEQRNLTYQFAMLTTIMWLVKIP